MIIRVSFEKSLEDLQHDILRMGSMVEQAIYDSVQSLAQQNVELAEKVIKGDRLINELEAEIEDKCIKLLATQQPMAKDLRTISTVFKLITDLERMGDHSIDIAKITKRLAGQPLIKPLIDIPRMANITQQMVRDALDAFVKRDVELAKALCKADDEVDHIYSQVFRELLTYMMEDPRNISQATYLLFCGRYLERIADHATNIGERIIYLVTGERADLNL